MLFALVSLRLRYPLVQDHETSLYFLFSEIWLLTVRPQSERTMEALAITLQALFKVCDTAALSGLPRADGTG